MSVVSSTNSSTRLHELIPTQPSLRSLTAIMITCSNSLEEGAGYPIITSVITAHHRDVRALPRANRASAIGRSPNLAATSSTDAPPASAPSLPWQSCVRGASQGGRIDCATALDFV